MDVGPGRREPGVSQAPIAAINGLTPTMFMTRVRLLHRTEGMFDCLATLAHRFWVCVKALLHSLE